MAAAVQLHPGAVVARPSAVRRRRLAAAVLGAALLVALVLVVRRPVAGSDPAAGPGSTPPSLIGHPTYVVQPGDTAWSVARSLHPVGDIRGVVDQLVALGGGRGLRVGQTLDLGRVRVDR